MKQFIQLANDILANGNERDDRTGTGTVSVFGRQLRFDLSDGFPLVTTRKMFLKGIVHELLWFLKGETNIKYLLDNGVHIWDDWVDPETAVYRELTLQERSELLSKRGEKAVYDYAMHIDDVHCISLDGDASEEDKVKRHEYLDSVGIPRQVLIDGQLGPVYPELWTKWKDSKGKIHNQIQTLIDGLKNKPFSRRHIVSTWNVPFLPDESVSPQENVRQGRMALAPCHVLFQFYVEKRKWSDVLDDLTDAIDEVGELFETRVKGMRSNDPIEGWVKAHAPGSGYRHPDYYTVGYKVAEEAGIPIYRLSCQLYQRSADWLVGSSFNIPSYALLTMMVAQCVNMVPGDFVYSLGDVHIYKDQIDIYKEKQKNNTPFPLPTLKLNPEIKDIFGFKFEDFELLNYQSHAKVEYPVAI